MSSPIARPGGVTLVAMLTWLSGLIEVYNGSVLLFQREEPDTVERFGGQSTLTLIAVVTLLVGVALLVIGVGLFRGSNPARVAASIAEGLSIVGSAFLAIAYPAGFIVEIVSIAIALIVIALLWTRRADAFFRRRP